MASQLGKNFVVSAGKAAFLRSGYRGTLRAPDLTVCTAALLRGKSKKSGDFVGYIMGHRQPKDLSFGKSLQELVKNEGLEDVTWEVVAVQTANDPSVDEGLVNSTDGMAKDLSNILDIETSEVYSKAERGVQQSFGVNQMIVEISQDGKETVQKRKGVFSECLIM